MGAGFGLALACDFRIASDTGYFTTRFAELGLSGLEDLPYYGIFAPVGTPQPVIDRFGDALAKVLAMPDVKQKLTTMGLTVAYEPQGQFAGRVRSYTQTWERIIKSSGFTPQ